MNMTTSRLDNVLQRNRRNAILDLVLVAFILVAVLFTGMAFGEELPNLTSAPAVAEQAPASHTAVAQADMPAPVRVARR
jgi:hypothetical protein